MSKKNDGVYVHTLKEPFEYEDKTYTEINFDFGKLTGKDAAAIEEELAAENHMIRFEIFDDKYLNLVAARAGGIAENVLTALPMLEYMDIQNAVRRSLAESRGEEPEVQMDLKKLTGADYRAVREELDAEGHLVVSDALDSEFRRKVAARASGMSEKDLMELPIQGYLSITGRVRNFLLRLA